MKAEIQWLQDFSVEANIDGHKVISDALAPHGHNSGPNPKALMLSTVGTCSAIGLITRLNMGGYKFSSLQIGMIGEARQKRPKVFEKIKMVYRIKSNISELDLEKILLAVNFEHCPVIAMLRPQVEFEWEIELGPMD